jgi:Flp pilus assembly protein TadG
MLTKLDSSAPERRQHGQALVIFSLFLVVLMATTGLAVDYGTWLKARRDYQNAVDPAALAGAALLTRPDTTAKRIAARTAAWDDLNRSLNLGLNSGLITSYSNGDTPAAGQTVGAFTIWVSTPPVNAGTAYPGAVTSSSARAMFVKILRANDAFFARVVGITSRTIDAWATAGTFPGKFAVITLRQNGQAPSSVSADITLNGSGTTLEVINGDVGGNWNMKLNSGSQLWLRGAADNDADPYLIDYTSCGNSCWSLGQVNSGPNGYPSNVQKAVLQLPGVIPDPNYALPTGITTPPTAPTVGGPVPLGDPSGSCCAKSNPGSVDIGGGSDNPPGGTSTVGGVLTCDPTSPRIGPGYYTKITVESGKCLILDATMRHTSVVSSPADVATAVPQSQLPGVFYVNGDININNNAMIVGDGVTIVQLPGSGNRMTVSSGGVLDLNRGMTPGGTHQRLGAFLRDGTQTYTWNGSAWVYNSSLESNPTTAGMAIYIVKRAQYSSVASDDNSNVINITSGSGLAWDGVTYAPHDNVTLSGQPGHDGVGQLVSWTFTFSGGTNVKQTYVGPDSSIPYLIEPRVGQ